jgi:ring-1,2-phenylacetyl-CoA epoxidase subunit PaaE
MSKFHSLRVIDVREETDDCKSIAFEIPEELREEFQYKQGQHLTIRAKIDGEDIRRNYSLCSSPLDNEWRVAVKKLPGGKFSTFANAVLKKGDLLDVMPPAGHFYTELNPDNKKHYVAFAAGSGITPMLSIIKTVLRSEEESTFTLVYGNRNTMSIIFHEEIEGLKNKYMERFSAYYILSREKLEEAIFNGRITADKCNELFNGLIDVKNADEFFICGPEEMIHAVNNSLQTVGVSEEKIHFELFTTPGADLGGEKRVFYTEEDLSKVSEVTVTSDGKTFSFNLAYGSANLLDAAMREGADLPFACKGGVCCTCKARLLEGEVEMERNYGLVKEEIEAGFILSCQAFPKSDKVVLNFDDI